MSIAFTSSKEMNMREEMVYISQLSKIWGIYVYFPSRK
jgi:hypothetical protein